MESSMASWQFENFSTAELSPPISPHAPLSPSLYNSGNGGISPNYSTSGKDVFLKPFYNQTVGPSRAQTTPTQLNELGHFSPQSEENDFSLGWSEESINLGLFSELSELDYVPPATPVSHEFSNQLSVSQFSEVSSVLPTSPIQQQQTEFPPVIFDQLYAAEFQAILESLPANLVSTSDEDFNDLISIVDNPTNLLQETQHITNFAAYAATNINSSQNFMEVDFNGANYSGVGVIGLDGNVSNQTGSILYPPIAIADYAMEAIPNFEVSDQALDANSDAAEKMLDALLLGNLTEAQSYLPTLQSFPIESPIVISTNMIEPATVQVNVVVKKEQAKPKSGGRRAKAAERKRLGGLNSVLDKSLRKKEQNKTAATRYRQKKKLESVVTSEVENDMQKANDILQGQANDLARQVSIVKQLLRDIMTAKKATQMKKRLH